VTVPYLAISGTVDTTAPITETLSGIHQLAGTRELVALNGVEHKLDVPSIPDIFTWALTFFDSEVRQDPAGRAKLVSMTSVTGGGDDHVLVPYNGPATVTPAPVNYQGMWWNPAESGWGIDFAHQGDVIFATWFTHDANGKAWYMSMTATETGPDTFSGTLIRTSGPALDALPFDPNQVQRTSVGSGTLTFSDANNGTLSYTVNGVSQTKTITKQVFGPVPACTWGTLADLTLATNYTDLWWATGGLESGWGINFTQQGDVIFATWFTYDANGKAWWLSMTGTKVADGTYSGTLNQTHGPAFSAVPFDPRSITIGAVGSALLTFTDVDNATFFYSVNGIAQTKAITRQVFGPVPACVWGALPDLAQATNHEDLWWAAPAGVESGWGINLTQEGSVIFATWFTYAADGTPLWLSATAPSVGPGTFAGPINSTTGPPFSSVPFDPARVTNTTVGGLTLTFASGNAGTFAYTVTLDGKTVTQTKAITRQIFRAPGTACQ